MAVFGGLFCFAVLFGAAAVPTEDGSSCQEVQHWPEEGALDDVTSLENEAQDASTVLLQVEFRRPAAAQRQVEMTAALLAGPRARLLAKAAAVTFADHLAAEDPYAEPYRLTMQNVNKSASDQIWAQIYGQLHDILTSSEDGKDWLQLCNSQRLDAFTAKGCAPTSGGSVLLGGIPADAYYCGSQHSGINWTGFSYRVSNLCTAEYGTAYTPTGICGSWTQKELIFNFWTTVPQWGANPLTINVPSLDCIMGIVDCDIYYCHHCADRCGAA